MLVAGNHDQSIEKMGPAGRGLRCHYLQDEGTELFGLRVQPRLMVCGHNGLGDTEVVNVSLVDEDYRPVSRVVSIDV